MATQITLKGSVEYNPSYPPHDAKKGYVAKITGRVSGAMKYNREFFGEEVTLVEGDEGLYERQNGLKKGGFARYYHVVLSHPEHGLIMSVDCEDIVPQIAKLLDDGIAIADAVEVTDLRPSERVEGRMIFTAVARTAAQAKKARQSATIDSAVATCLDVLRLLPEAEQKKAMSAIKAALKPTPPAADPADAQ